jgi:hypothetical protein
MDGWTNGLTDSRTHEIKHSRTCVLTSLRIYRILNIIKYVYKFLLLNLLILTVKNARCRPLILGGVY